MKVYWSVVRRGFYGTADPEPITHWQVGPIRYETRVEKIIIKIRPGLDLHYGWKVTKHIGWAK